MGTVKTPEEINNMKIDEMALCWLHTQLRRERAELGRAEYKGVANDIAHYQNTVNVLEWLMKVAVKEVK